MRKTLPAIIATLTVLSFTTAVFAGDEPVFIDGWDTVSSSAGDIQKDRNMVNAEEKATKEKSKIVIKKTRIHAKTKANTDVKETKAKSKTEAISVKENNDNDAVRIEMEAALNNP